MRWLFKNLGYKITALILAVFIWGLVQSEEVIEDSREVLITVQHPDDVRIRGEVTRLRVVKLRGPRVLFAEVPRILKASVVVPKGVQGAYRVRIDRTQITNLPDRLELTVHDPYLNLYVGRQAHRYISVKEVLQGTPAKGTLIRKINVKPKRVKVTGLYEDVNRIDQINTEYIDIDGLSQNKSFEVRLVPPRLAPAGLEVDTVSVQLEVGDSQINKRFSNIPVEILDNSYITFVKPKVVSIEIQGTPSTLSFVDKKELRAFVEVRNLAPGKYDEEIKVKIPPDTVLIEVLPARATVEVRPQKRLD